MNMWLLIILVCISVSNVKPWILPPRDFLSNFANEHDRTSIIIYLPQKIPQKWIKDYFVGCGGSNETFPMFFVIPSLVANFSWVSTTNEDLHIFVPDDKDGITMKNSIDVFMHIYGLRIHSRKEHWLLDITYWTDTHKASNELAKLPTDLDDDMYWYNYLDYASESLNFTNGYQSVIELFEVYKINEDMNMTINYYGNWSQLGIKFVEKEKWRRRNLQVFFINVLSSLFNFLHMKYGSQDF